MSERQTDLVAAGARALFVMVPHELIDDPEIDALAIATYVALRRFADFGSGDGAFPSDAKAAERAGCAVRTFQARRELLRQRGWIEWEARPGRTNLYVIHDRPTYAGDAEVRSAGDADPTPAHLVQDPSAGSADPSAPGADLPRRLVPTTDSQDRETIIQIQDGEAATPAERRPSWLEENGSPADREAKLIALSAEGRRFEAEALRKLQQDRPGASADQLNKLAFERLMSWATTKAVAPDLVPEYERHHLRAG